MNNNNILDDGTIGVKDEVFSRSTSDDVVVGVDLIPLVLMLTLICVYYSGTMLV